MLDAAMHGRMSLSLEELRRYARQMILPEVGKRGQEKLRAASVLCIGAGGLGSPAALYLAAAGIGRLGLIESDVVDVSNLQRQILHHTADLGAPKTRSAEASLRALNPHVTLETHSVRLDAANALDLLRGYDWILDGTDNFVTRYLVNDACVLLGKANVYGAVLRFEGQASVFAPHLGGPCYRCLFPEPPPPGSVPNCAEAGVLGVLPGIIGTLQASETLKLILGIGQPLIGRLVVFDALRATFRELRLRRDPGCPVCGPSPSITRLVAIAETCVPSAPAPDPCAADDNVSVSDMRDALGDAKLGIRVLDVREPHEHEVGLVANTLPCPLSTFDQWIGTLDPNLAYYLCCRSGVRSLRALARFRQHGLRHVKSVEGGLLAWSREVDPSLPVA
jgi:adenylyltransferase/sulfurtransferase